MAEIEEKGDGEVKLEPGYYWYKGPFFGLMGGGEDWEVLRVDEDGDFSRHGLDVIGENADLRKMQKQGRFIKIEPPPGLRPGVV